MSFCWEFNFNKVSDDFTVYLFPTVWYQRESFHRTAWHSVNIAWFNAVLKMELELEKRKPR